MSLFLQMAAQATDYQLYSTLLYSTLLYSNLGYYTSVSGKRAADVAPIGAHTARLFQIAATAVVKSSFGRVR